MMDLFFFFSFLGAKMVGRTGSRVGSATST